DTKLVESKILQEIHKDISEVRVVDQPAKDAAEEKPVPEDHKMGSKELTKQASLVYQDRSNYVEAYELSEKALVLDPKNEEAARVKDQIETDLKHHNTDIISYAEKYTPPEGALAYKVAVSDNQLTLREALDISMKNSVLYKSLKQRVEGGRAKLYEAKRALWPTASLELRVGGGLVGGSAYTNETWKANLSQPMYYGGELIFTVKQAEAGLKSDEAKLEKERLEITAQVAEAYRGVVNAVYNEQFQSKAYDEIKGTMEMETKMYAEKLVPEVEHLELLTIYNTAILTKEQVEISLDSAYLTLFQSLGVPMSEKIPVDMTVELEPVSIDYDAYIRMVQNNNLDIIIKEMAAKTAFYAIKVQEAKKKIRVDLRGAVGLSGETNIEHAAGPDLENEHFLVVSASVPFGANTANYQYQRRFFGPTLSSFRGSEDWEHKWTIGILDNLANITDYEIGKADYAKAQAELANERVEQELTAKQYYYDYQTALLQIEMSEKKLEYRKKQLELVRHTTLMADSRLSELISAINGMAEDQFTKISTINNAKSAIWNMNRAIGIEGYYGE
ncbi:MAG: TolC family protein, partial [Candidatus Omnitrophica bacterium]|nr:TolC family protein [Candidatus Omnitrophota bacterium]